MEVVSVSNTVVKNIHTRVVQSVVEVLLDCFLKLHWSRNMTDSSSQIFTCNTCPEKLILSLIQTDEGILNAEVVLLGFGFFLSTDLNHSSTTVFS